MTLKVMEGTWEEIQLHSRELTGHKVRVQVLDDAISSQPAQQQESADAWVRSFLSWAESHDPAVPLLSDEAVSRESIYSDRTCAHIPTN